MIFGIIPVLISMLLGIVLNYTPLTKFKLFNTFMDILGGGFC